MRPFERAMEFVARWEGGYSNDPADPGGATNMGITQRTFDAWRDENGLPRDDVRNLTVGERDRIYEAKYWAAAGCDVLDWPLSLVHFDTAVNCGVARARQFLKESAGSAKSYIARRRTFYTDLARRRPPLQRFLKGWINRIAALETAASNG